MTSSAGMFSLLRGGSRLLAKRDIIIRELVGLQMVPAGQL